MRQLSPPHIALELSMQVLGLGLELELRLCSRRCFGCRLYNRGSHWLHHRHRWLWLLLLHYHMLCCAIARRQRLTDNVHLDRCGRLW